MTVTTPAIAQTEAGGPPPPPQGTRARMGGSGNDTGLVWAPRRQITLEKARQRSDLVRILRMAFTYGAAASIGLLAGYVIQSIFTGGDERRSFRGSEIVTMVNPRFSGRDAAGQAYVITADSAQRRRGRPDLIDLVNPKLVDDDGTQVTAPEGTYNQSDITLELFRDVAVADAAGYMFSSTRAVFYVNEGRVRGIEPLDGIGPLGDIRSDTYDITDDGAVIHFSGNVEMTFYPDPPAEPEEAGAGDAPEIQDNENG